MLPENQVSHVSEFWTLNLAVHRKGGLMHILVFKFLVATVFQEVDAFT
jgi:hypothetical protein